ncbi:MAG: DUF2079 domain-containing protein [Candidatus Eremiobacteraeota bacterium]|nr:DUF2079 domain-containing protein [Candidatus Eremiobacteraeota bacterium]
MLRRIWLGSIAYFIVFFALGADRYSAHRSAEDLGIFFQTIASAFSGFSNTIEGASHLTVHFSPILYLLAPLVWITHSALALVAVQAAANACVAPALFLIARKRVDERAATWIASIGFFYPPLWGVTFTDFHENGLVPATIAWLIYALDARKFRLAFGFVLLALCIKEDQAVFLAFLACLSFIGYARKGDNDGRTWAILTLASSAAAFIGFFTIVRPLAGAHGGWHPSVFYTQTKATAITTPLRNLTDRLGYLILAFAPLAFLPFRSSFLILSIPAFAEVLLSRAPVTYTMGQHYAAVWIPYVLVASVAAACDLEKNNPAVARRAIRFSYTVCALILLIANPLHPKYFLRIPQAADAQLDQFIAGLPHDIDLGTQEEAFTHMGFYPGATLGMEEYPQYALFDWHYPDSNWVMRDGPKIKTEVARGGYRIVRSENGIVLYQRIGPKPRSALTSSPAW